MRRFFNILQDQNLSDADFVTIQNARLDLIGELEAIDGYSIHLRQANKLSAQVTIRDILEEEQVHVGELMALLFKLDPEFKKNFDKGVEEFNNRLATSS